MNNTSPVHFLLLLERQREQLTTKDYTFCECYAIIIDFYYLE